MRFNWLIPSALGAASALVITLPAEAAQLQFWRFDARQNQLVFTTDVAVQPRAQLIFNPTRIVIDLPNTVLGSATARQSVGGTIREVRAGQFNEQTTRLVIELEAGYTVNPQQVQVRGQSANQWVVQLPTPERVAAQPSPPPAAVDSGASPNSVSGQPAAGATSRLDSVTATPDGFFVRTRGQVPNIRVQRTGRRNDRRITIDLPDTAIAANLSAQDLPNNRYSIRRWQITQQQTAPPSAQITLELDEGSPDWQINTTNLGGIIIVPPRGVSINSISDRPGPSAPPIATTPTTPAAPTTPIAVPPAPQPPPLPPRIDPPAIPPIVSPPPTVTPPVQNSRVVITIDPGHGGRDPGAVGRGGLQEKQVIFPISLRVRELLEQNGVSVVLTREQDVTLDLEPRVQIAERANADLFVSIHANAISLSRPEVNGTETYYYSDAGLRLARIMHANMLSAGGLNDRGVRQARFYVIRNTSMPAVLLEVGFVTGARDAPLLADPTWREQMAQGIANGILEYVNAYLR
ncbi:MAG: N-acetylmuramoyl-L-alanine amidase [Leptolyngbyaceae cyanobacterium SL_1_1]|nr:N-acetylmuramoyl-L-alanine amidase [Leptolyngbyaceae cyanobacterium RM1_1_2]NJO11002.1 N-acetylmuramoyl-L-alanine amidase [Leptolyngbyaceae cyanobacterium SL_1_1]